MGIQDYVYRIKPAAGQPNPVNEVDSGQTVSTTGTQTLTDRGGGDYAWAFSGGTASGLMDPASIITTAAGNGITRAITVRVTAWGSSDQIAWAGAAETTTLTTGGMFIGVNDRAAKTLRARLNGTAGTLSLGAIGDGVDVTIVQRMYTNFSGSSEQHAAWIKGASHSGTNPDVSSTATTVGSPYTLDTLVYATPNSATYQIIDDVWWYEALSDTDCLALAEDLRGTLDPSTVPTGTVTISSAESGSSTTALITYSYDAADQTGFEYSLDGVVWASIGASPATITGLTAATEYAIEVRAINGFGGGTASTPVDFGTLNIFTGGTEIGNGSSGSRAALFKLGVSVGIGFS